MRPLDICGMPPYFEGTLWDGAGVAKRGSLSKQGNKHRQTVLIEAAKLTPRWSPELALAYDNILQEGNRHRATLAGWRAS